MMGIIKTKIEDHIKESGNELEVQAGFTKRRQIADNLFILNYCITESYKKKKESYLHQLTFQKHVIQLKEIY